MGFLSSSEKRIVAAAQPKTTTDKENLSVGMDIGAAYRAGWTREQVIKSMVASGKFTSEAADVRITRWQTNRKMYNLSYSFNGE